MLANVNVLTKEQYLKFLRYVFLYVFFFIRIDRIILG